MILTCPSCSTRYLIDPSALGEIGRVVRCARCAHSWMETPPEDMPKRVDVAVAPAVARPIPPGSNLPALPDAPKSSGWASWAALAAVVIAVLGGTVAARERIVEAWPLTERLYLLAGLAEPRPSTNFILRRIQSSTFLDDGHTIVVVTGEIVNVSGETRLVPNLEARVLDNQRRVLDSWIVAPPIAQLAPGGAVAFSNRFADPPVGYAELSVDFATR